LLLLSPLLSILSLPPVCAIQPTMPARAGLRLFSQASRNAPFRTRQTIFRRHNTTAGVNTGPIEAPTAPQNIFQRMWTSEVGVKTVHFWAPVMKWGVVLAGAADFFRPPEKLSLTQNLALMATGSIWTRWCFVIRPQNMLLAAVNFCLFIVGTTQVSRILMYQASVKGSTTEAVKDLAGEVKSEGRLLEEKSKKELA